MVTEPVVRREFIPRPELAPPSVNHLSPQRRIELWAQLVDEGDALLRSGLRARIGPQGDLNAAYREWYARRMDEHERWQIALAANLTQREAAHGK